MALAITKENKNSLSLSNEAKISLDQTWDEAKHSWNEAGRGTWDLQRLPLTKESKNSLSIINENKN